LSSKFSLEKIKVGLSNVYFVLALIIGTISWWIYVSYAVLLQTTLITSLILQGEMRSFSPQAAKITDVSLSSQLNLISLLSNLTLAIIILPIIPVLIQILNDFRHKKLGKNYRNILLLTSVTFVLQIMFILLKIIQQSGFAQRFSYAGDFLLVLLSAVCIFDLLSWKIRWRWKMIYVPLAVLLTCAVVISPFTSLSDYGSVNLIGIASTDTHVGNFASVYSVSQQHLAGDWRFLYIVGYLNHNLQISTEDFDNNVKNNVFVYSAAETEIIVSDTTPVFSTGNGLQESNVTSYINNLYNISNLVYNNNYNTIFVLP